MKHRILYRLGSFFGKYTEQIESLRDGVKFFLALASILAQASAVTLSMAARRSGFVSRFFLPLPRPALC